MIQRYCYTVKCEGGYCDTEENRDSVYRPRVAFIGTKNIRRSNIPRNEKDSLKELKEFLKHKTDDNNRDKANGESDQKETSGDLKQTIREEIQKSLNANNKNNNDKESLKEEKEMNAIKDQLKSLASKINRKKDSNEQGTTGDKHNNNNSNSNNNNNKKSGQFNDYGASRLPTPDSSNDDKMYANQHFNYDQEHIQPYQFYGTGEVAPGIWKQESESHFKGGYGEVGDSTNANKRENVVKIGDIQRNQQVGNAGGVQRKNDEAGVLGDFQDQGNY